MTAAMQSTLMSVEQAATRMGTPVRFIRRLIAERRIPFTKVGRYVRFYPEDIEAFLDAGRVEPMKLSWRSGKVEA